MTYIRFELRINDLERGLREKVSRHELSSINSVVDRLERAMREFSSIVDGLRNELEECRNENRRLEDLISETINVTREVI